MSQGMHAYFDLMVKHGGSDFFLSPGAPPTIKLDGIARPINAQPLDETSVKELVYSVLTPEEIQDFEETLELNKALHFDDIGRFRINVYRQRGMTALVARHIHDSIPAIAELGLPPLLETLVMEERGLILITGVAGSGKSTTLSSMIDYRNRHRSGHMLLIEDPIEFIHSHQHSIVDQREIGLDTLSFDNALRNAMREAPDVIVIGEIRDMETMKHALAYAETGHLCLATLHASNAHQAVERVLNFFDLQHRRQVQLDLSLHLRATISQRLIRSVDGKRVPAIEIMLNTPLIAELIRTGRLDEISSAISQHNEHGACSFDQALFQLWEDKRVDRDEALTHADSRANLSLRMRLNNSPGADTMYNITLQ